MNRIALINFHLALGALFLPFLFIMPITGGLHLLGVDGEVTKTPAFTIVGSAPEDQKAQEDFFREQFKSNGVDYSFEYLRSSGKDFLFRPTTRVYYTATKTETGYEITKVSPDLFKRLFELHKGHGPKWMKIVEGAFAVALMLVAISGCYLAISVPRYRRLLLVSGLLGFLIVLAGLF